MSAPRRIANQIRALQIEIGLWVVVILITVALLVQVWLA